jgi:5-methylcytosine-specific restriction endonuclease McrA
MSWTHQPDRLKKYTKERPPAAVVRQTRDAARDKVYRDNSKLARERDGHHCRVCGSLFNLETHHLVPRSLAGRDVRDLVANLVTLCADCHKDVTKHIVKLFPIVPELGAAACNLRVEKFDKDEGDYLVAMEAA